MEQHSAPSVSQGTDNQTRHYRNSKNQGVKLIERTASSMNTRATIGGIGLLALSCALAQSQQVQSVKPATTPTHAIPLVSGACPAVNTGESVSLDWNPGFDPSWEVAGLRVVSLRFQMIADNGVSTTPSRISMLLRSSEERISASGNGYFHITIPIPPRTIAGVYHLIDAHATPRVSQEYQGPPPQMTVSPVRESYCVTVAPRARTQSPPDQGGPQR